MGIEINPIVKLFEDLRHGHCWAGNNFKETLQGVDGVTAAHTLQQKVTASGI